jgi:predicted Zn-dependent protease with MMP-like domain
MPPDHEVPSLDDLVALAERALAAIPRLLAARIDNVGFVVQDWPDAETLRKLNIRNPLGLLGLYRGIPLIRRSIMQPWSFPDRIFLYRQPILHSAARLGLDPYRMVRHVLIHEIAHHFGYSEAEIDALQAEP